MSIKSEIDKVKIKDLSDQKKKKTNRCEEAKIYNSKTSEFQK